MKIEKTEKRVKEIERLRSYRVRGREYIEEIDSEALRLEHVKTGAKFFLLLNEDDNKVFSIGFRTPSLDSTGAAHILEHCVLCGSEKFPAKDPFVELAKGSLNTFLNAMTYPDKTVYPAASCNHKDFTNLMEVYFDAVFYPNIYKEGKIFKQEGWHYELESAKDDLQINGVVYNEMKGVFSSVDGMLERAVTKTLFEGHSYGEESGGDPQHIPELDEQKFKAFHQRYYHPSNAFIYLYGDADMAKRLEWMDREYLSHFEKKEVDSRIEPVSGWGAPRERRFEYSVTKEEGTKNKSYLSLHTVVGGELDPLICMGFQILDYVLLEVPGAPLEQALIDAGIGEEIDGGYEYGISEPFFSVIAKNTDEEKKAEFLAVVKGVLRKLANGGLDKDALRAAINISEFKAREADFGGYPKGLIYGLSSYESWIYGGDPGLHLKYREVFERLRAGVDEGFFENLIRDHLLDNPFEACIILSPREGLTEEKERTLAQRLARIKEGLSDRELEELVRETKELKRYQEEPSRREDLLKIPMLEREDLEREAQAPIWEKKSLKVEDRELEIIFSEVFTSKIAYWKLIFDADRVSAEELPYLALLKEIFGYIDTEQYSYAKLATEINQNSGGLGFGFESYARERKEGDEAADEIRMLFSVNIKILYDKFLWAAETAPKILLSSRLDDKKRIREILLELKAKQKEKLLAAGHVTALNRAGSHISKSAYFSDATRGIRFYRFLEAHTADFEASAEGLIEKLKNLAARIFCRENLRIHLTSDREGYECLLPAAGALYRNLPATKHEKGGGRFRLEKTVKREAFSSASQVNYVARFGNFAAHGFAYTGALRLLKMILSYDYLWNRIRTKGGAYGCAASFVRNGNAGFTSYRDPNIGETDRTYRGIAEFVSSFEADEREMRKTIIGAIGELDAPLTPSAKGLRGLGAYMSGVDYESIERERRELLDASAEDIRALAPLIEAVISDGLCCTIGNAGKISEAADLFTDIEAMVSTGEDFGQESEAKE